MRVPFAELGGSKRAIAAGVFCLGGAMVAGSVFSDPPKTTVHRDVSPAKACTGLEFDINKGGPGLVMVGVEPILQGQRTSAEMIGKIVSGNDKGEAIVNRPSALDEGEFDLTYNTAATKTQFARVSVSILVPGFTHLQACPDTTLHFNPQSGAYGPVFGK